MKYDLKEIRPNIFAAVVPDGYDRAMLFCRAQEFYESAGPQFRNSKFSIWDYFRWYGKKYKSDCFSYPKDFVGFNFPVVVAKKCYQINDQETPYDKLMCEIIDGIFVNGKRQYLIGTNSLKNSTFLHELAHAFYYTDIDYKAEMDEITSSISRPNMTKFRKNLRSLGYCSDVMKDEIQAYMATEISKKVAKGIANKKKIHQRYKSVFKRHSK